MFSDVELAPRDPILGLTEAFNADSRPMKVNLGAGVYSDDNGRIPLLAAVRNAERARLESAPARGYLPIEGIAGYNLAVQHLLFGQDSPVLAEGRVATFECLGGTGALRVGADFLKRLRPEATVWISDPSWENHRALFESAGFRVQSYPYYDASTHGLDFDAMLARLGAIAGGSIVVLHACCHNPTGVDLAPEQWDRVIEVLQRRELVPFLDCAYQGFGDGIDADADPIRRFARSGLGFFVASSFSKSFSLYGERVGALSIVTENRDETARVVSQVKRVVRTNYSNPPTHGAAIVAAVLGSAQLRATWEEELAGMRERIRAMRVALVAKLAERGVKRDFSFVAAQRGMFSYSGLSSAQVDRLREEFGIYAVGTGRICLAALNSRNIDYVADSIAKVLGS
ncbi:MAG: aspartate/tyrosine/aromatic aminotransferase [Burkholderiaceae bacterium]|nr:aspartate/tyrosine/aromatic aminotransferase [Burkholderiaceae bacterium]